MERIAIAMQDGGAGAGARHEAAARAARPTSFCLAAEPLYGSPVGGTFWFQIFIQAPSSEIWRKPICGGEGGCWRGKWGGLFWATSLGKNFWRRDRDHLVPPRRTDAAVCRAEVCYPFGSELRETLAVKRRAFITLLVAQPTGHREEVVTSKAAMPRGRPVSRRSFVMTLAAAAAAPAAQAQAPAPGTSAAPAGGPKGREQRMLIVDAQIHIWKSSKPNPNHRQIADYSADDALKEMDEAGVTAAVIHPPGWDPNANALA